MGLPKIAAIPAAVPQLISRMDLSGAMWSMRPMLPPMEAPVSTLGVVSPAEPPVPTVRELAKMCDSVSSLMSFGLRSRMD